MFLCPYYPYTTVSALLSSLAVRDLSSRVDKGREWLLSDTWRSQWLQARKVPTSPEIAITFRIGPSQYKADMFGSAVLFSFGNVNGNYSKELNFFNDNKLGFFRISLTRSNANISFEKNHLLLIRIKSYLKFLQRYLWSKYLMYIT